MNDMPANDSMVEARSLTKRFGEFVAVDAVDFTVARGEAFGFLGPNGAGKSSTMKMIGAVSPVTSGELRVFGRDPAADGATIRARLGVVPQENNLDTELPVEENLYIYGRYFDLPRPVIQERIKELIEFAQLSDRAGAKVDSLSGGMQRRLTIARSLINEPDMILLDEPTTGLDPQARHLLWDRLYRLKQQGVTLIITTHYMDEAEQLCDRLVVMDQGRIVAEGSPRDLIAKYSPARSSSCGSRLVSRSRRWPNSTAWRNGSRNSRTACSCIQMTAITPQSRFTPAASFPSRSWCGGARWRMCSFASPEGHWSSDHTRRRAVLRGASAHLPPHLAGNGDLFLRQSHHVSGSHGSRARNPGR